MNKYFADTGTLTEEGRKLISCFSKSLSELLESDDVKDMSEQDLRTLGAHLAAIIGDAVSNKISSKTSETKATNRFSGMNNQEFDSYLKEKYGEMWLFMTLDPEEFERAQTLLLEAVKNNFEEDNAKVFSAPPPMMPLCPNGSVWFPKPGPRYK